MENENKKYSCCFFGHRKIDETPEMKEKLIQTVEYLITGKDVTRFYFGSRSQFDSLCLEVVTGLKEKYPYVKRIYVRSAFPDISQGYEDYLLESYDKTYFPEKIRGAGKASYVERNQEMIDSSNFCVVYYDESYCPPKRIIGKRIINEYQPKSGTQVAYDYAVKKKCEIINVLKSI